MVNITKLNTYSFNLGLLNQSISLYLILITQENPLNVFISPTNDIIAQGISQMGQEQMLSQLKQRLYFVQTIFEKGPTKED